MDRKEVKLGSNEILYENEYGYIVYKQDVDYCEIHLIEIDKYKKLSGKGSELLNNFLKEKQEKDKIHEFYLEAILIDSSVMTLDDLAHFYEKFGFIEYNRTSEDGEKEKIYMTLKLD